MCVLTTITNTENIMFRFIKQYKKIKWLAYHDSLTGLLNRNWLYENINTITFKYVYFIDINDLKKVNESGHTIGDNFIKDAVLSVKLEKTDILIRYAGDEFILLSNRLNAVETNELFSVGFSEIKESLITAINISDSCMLKSKQLYKKWRC